MSMFCLLVELLATDLSCRSILSAGSQANAARVQFMAAMLRAKMNLRPQANVDCADTVAFKVH
jgi:hypothetical protein